MGPLLFLVLLVPFTINGLAVRESFFVSFLGGLGVDPSLAFATGFLFFVVTVTLSIPGAIILGWEHLRPSARRGARWGTPTHHPTAIVVGKIARVGAESGATPHAARASPRADVSVVVVTYNALPWIERCLTSIAGYETVVVDHGSTDGTVERGRAALSGGSPRRAGEPSASAPGWNRGIRETSGAYVLDPERRRVGARRRGRAARRLRRRAPARRGRRAAPPLSRRPAAAVGSRLSDAVARRDRVPVPAQARAALARAERLLRGGLRPRERARSGLRHGRGAARAARRDRRGRARSTRTSSSSARKPTGATASAARAGRCCSRPTRSSRTSPAPRTRDACSARTCAGILRFIAKHEGARAAARTRWIVLAGCLLRAPRDRQYLRIARWLASGSVPELLAGR